MSLANFGIEVKKTKPEKTEETKNKNLQTKNKEKETEQKDSVAIKIEEITSKDLELNFDTIKENLLNENLEKIQKFLPWFLKYCAENEDNYIETPTTKKVEELINAQNKSNNNNDDDSLKTPNTKKPQKPLLLIGTPGSGKTTTIQRIAKKYGLELFELNASDTRNKASIEQTLGEVLAQKSLFQRQKLILIDEVDGVSGTNDRGGIAQIQKYIKTSPYQIIFAANDKDSEKIDSLRKICTTIDFENHSKELLFELGKHIFKNENIKFNEKDLEEFIVERNTSDIRGFVNDLQASTTNSKFEINKNLEIRNYKKIMENVLDKIFYSHPQDALESTWNSNVELDELMLYLEENCPNTLSKKALVMAFEQMSKADTYRGKITKWQYWRFLVYVNFYLTYAISTIKDTPKKTNYKRNERILKKWIYANKYNMMKERTKIQKENKEPQTTLEKLAKLYKHSAKKTKTKDFYYFVYSYKNSKEFRDKINAQLEITPEEEEKILGLEN